MKGGERGLGTGSRQAAESGDKMEYQAGRKPSWLIIRDFCA